MLHRRGAIAPALLFSLALTLAPVVPTAAQDAPQEDKDAEREAKRQAREARIEEYLRKREQRRAQRELERQQKQDPKQQPESIDLSTFADEKPKKGYRGETEVILPRELARVQAIVRNGPLGGDPTVQGYLDLIDRAEASPQQLAAFGSFLADSGWPRGAIEYYRVALGLEPEDPVLWLNVGTIHRQMGEPRPAMNAYRRALSVDPNNAFAHYNLGAVLDALGKYETAVVEYKIALTLDPSLGDPAVNPQAANNARLIAVKLMLYEEQAGNLGLPLAKVPGGELPEAAEADSADR